MPKGKRGPNSTQITVSIPKALLADIDALAAADDRNRSNWVVRELGKAVAAEKAKKNITVLPTALGADDPSSDTTATARIAEEPPPPRRRGRAS